MRVVGLKPRSSKSFFFLGGTKMPYVVRQILKGPKLFKTKLMSTIKCQIHGIQN